MGASYLYSTTKGMPVKDARCMGLDHSRNQRLLLHTTGAEVDATLNGCLYRASKGGPARPSASSVSGLWLALCPVAHPSLGTENETWSRRNRLWLPEVGASRPGRPSARRSLTARQPGP